MVKALRDKKGRFMKGNQSRLGCTFISKKKGKNFQELYGQKRANKLMQNHSKIMKEKSLKGELIIPNQTGFKHTNITKKIIGEYAKKSRAKQIIPLKDTTIEIKIQNFLKTLKIDFFTHQYIKEINHSYQCDILIPSMKLVIECDGNYWHKYPIGKNIDHLRTKELLEKGFKVLRLWEREIRRINLIQFKEKLEEIKNSTS